MDQQVYYIDQKILAVFNNLTDEAAAEQAYDDYLEQQGILRVAAIQAFMQAKGLTEETIQAYTDYLQKSLTEFLGEPEITIPDVPSENNPVPAIDQEKIAFITNMLSSQEGINFVENYLQAYNRSLYEKADQTLTVEQKKELNTYLQTVDQEVAQAQAETKAEVKKLIAAQKQQPENPTPTMPQINLTQQPQQPVRP